MRVLSLFIFMTVLTQIIERCELRVSKVENVALSFFEHWSHLNSSMEKNRELTFRHSYPSNDSSNKEVSQKNKNHS